MTLFARRDPWQLLDALLDQERRAILEGDYPGLAAVLRRKEQMLAARRAVPDNQRLVKLAEKSRRNANLLAAAGRGVQSAQARLNALRGAAGGLNTYGPGGVMTRLGTPPRSVRRSV